MSKRIIAAVDEIANPKSETPKATKQLAAKMAKIIVAAAATKSDSAPSSFRTFSFTNKFGEEFQLTVDAAGHSGILAGDETDWENLCIKEDALQDDFMFSDDELAWLRTTWKTATGRALKHPIMTAEQQLLEAAALHNMTKVAGKKKFGAKSGSAKALNTAAVQKQGSRAKSKHGLGAAKKK